MKLYIIFLGLLINLSLYSAQKKSNPSRAFDKHKKSSILSVDLTNIDDIDSLHYHMRYLSERYVKSFMVSGKVFSQVDTTSDFFRKLSLILVVNDSLFKKEKIIRNTHIVPFQNIKHFDNEIIEYNIKRADILVSFKPIHFDVEGLYNECMNFWYSTGKVTNILISNPENIYPVREVVNKLNSTPRISGIVEDESGKSLTNVEWKEYPYLKTSGYFTYPTPLSPRMVMSPKKAGYKFYPEMMYYTENTKYVTKKFKAVKHNIQNALILDIGFDGKIYNTCSPNDKFSWHDIEVRGDNKKGNIGYFNGSSTYINCGNKYHFSDEFTISLWFKSDNISEKPMGLISKGKEFSIRVTSKMWSFVTTNESSRLNIDYSFESNRWYNLAIVFHEREHVSFYVDGKLIKTFDDNGRYRRTSNSIIIGDNIWNESFKGSLDNIRIWSRELSDEEIADSMKDDKIVTVKSSNIYLILVILLIVLAVGVIIYLNYFRSSKGVKSELFFKKEFERGSKIEIFGDFYVSNENGEDMSHKFSPLSRNLFIFILIHSLKEKEGVTTQLLTETFWPGYAVENAKNARGTAINKLRHTLNDCGNITVLFKEKRWIIDFDKDSIFCDLYYYYQLVHSINEISVSADIKKYSKLLLKIVKNGSLVPSIESEWFDSFKDEITNEVLDLCQAKVENLSVEKESATILKLSDIIFKFDNLNEFALEKKIQSLIHQGLHSHANVFYNKFAKLYHELYSEEFDRSFNSIINKETYSDS